MKSTPIMPDARIYRVDRKIAKAEDRLAHMMNYPAEVYGDKGFTQEQVDNAMAWVNVWELMRQLEQEIY